MSTHKSYAEDTSIHGAACLPANLSQALAFGLGWSQFGVTNNSPIGGGSFFVICPLQVENETTKDTTFDTYDQYLPNIVEVEIAYLDPAALDVSCTLIVTNVGAQGGSNPVVISAQDMLVSPNPGAPSSAGLGGALIDGSGFFSGLDAISVLCAVHPQTRIGHIDVFWETLPPI